jgi:hypothetical protein
VVTLDVSELTPYGTAMVVLRLVGPDTDPNTKVRIRGCHPNPTVELTGDKEMDEAVGYALGLSVGNLNQDTVTKWEINWGDGG